MIHTVFLIFAIILTIVNIVDMFKRNKKIEFADRLLNELIQNQGQYISDKLIELMKGEMIDRIDTEKLVFFISAGYLQLNGDKLHTEVKQELLDFLKKQRSAFYDKEKSS